MITPLWSRCKLKRFEPMPPTSHLCRFLVSGDVGGSAGNLWQGDRLQPF
ncbi:hypothetical protein [Lyngbya confervoides]|uniref:Uncharacterized protein n=1 Tax=Lyngbya confervoides BDU141951 TaxID=1574623 RepID=A0ABD4SZJ7_9CYAN|nr:hypothetical protein [Lyngbya confervoides]MCM1981739.1 hypothetical protein [Lyngbya confervoides BDU141951]